MVKHELAVHCQKRYTFGASPNAPSLLRPDMRVQSQEKEVAVWIRVPVGIVLTAVILLCIAGVTTIFLDLPKENPLFALALGAVLILLSFWGLNKSLRMVFGWRRRERFFSPKTLTTISYVFLLLPIGGIFTGYYSENGFAGILQAVVSVGIFYGLCTLAKSGEAIAVTHDESPTSRN